MPWRSVSAEDADHHLSRLGLKLGTWNQFATLRPAGALDPRTWTHHRAPRDAYSLFTFSQYVAAWLPSGDWKLVQIDNSTSHTIDQATLIYALLEPGRKDPTGAAEIRNSYVFDFNGALEDAARSELLLSHLIFLFLLFESHVYLVSSACDPGQYLGVQDGYVYFVSPRSEGLARAQSLLADFAREPMRSPQWIQTLIAEADR